MSSSQARLRTRTPQACERCRRSKTKCLGDRPQCRSCLKRGVACSWAQLAPIESHYSLTPVADQDVVRIAEKEARSQDLTTGPLPAKYPPAPQPRQLQRLFDIFFARHHDVEFCSFFHRPSLYVPILYERFPLLVHAILSLSALYVKKDEVETDYGFRTPGLLSEHYARIAKAEAFSMSDRPSITTIQAYLILSIRELMVWSNVKAYLYAGTAIRMAQALYLNFEAGQNCSSRQKEVRRRTFWSCFVVDRLISYSCNKSFTISSQSMQIQLPCPENVFAFDEVSKGLFIKDLIHHTSPVSQLGVMPYFISAVQLWGDVALLHVSGGRRRSKYGPYTAESEFYQSRKAIEEFYSHLPSVLSWSPQNFKLHQVTGQVQLYVNLCFVLNHSMCVMHQEYLPQLDTQYALDLGADYMTSTYDTAGISLDYSDDALIKQCIFSINTITDIALTLNSGTRTDKELLQSVLGANAILTASAVHLWVLYTQTCDVCPKHEALARAEKLRQIIKSWQPQWKVATAWVETLEMLYKLYVYSYGKVVESELDRWDIGNDDINENAEISGEIGDASANQQMNYEENGVSDPLGMSQRLYDKVRSILVNPLLSTDVKKRNLRTYSRTLWQHMWTFGPMDGSSDDLVRLETLMGDPGLTLTNLPSSGIDLDSI